MWSTRYFKGGVKSLLSMKLVMFDRRAYGKRELVSACPILSHNNSTRRGEEVFIFVPTQVSLQSAIRALSKRDMKTMKLRLLLYIQSVTLSNSLSGVLDHPPT